MSDLRDLYQEVIVDHSRRPRNFKKLDRPTHHAEGFNPLCGDRVEVYLTLENGVVKDLAFQGAGCAISTASASMMTEMLKGKSAKEADEVFAKFHAMVTSPPDEEPDTDSLGKLAVFAGVCEFPARVKCASLCWHTLKNALSGNHELVTLE
jgi:nitrogen fixation protein NifU and related proteins